MDTRHVRVILPYFLAVYGWMFRFVNGSWWAWNVDEEHWDWMDAKGRIGDILVIITRDSFPGEPKILAQIERQYIQEQLIRQLRPHLAHAVLPGSPRSQ